MELHPLVHHSTAVSNPKIAKLANRYTQLLCALKEHQHRMPEVLIQTINRETDWLVTAESEKEWGKSLETAYHRIVKEVDKQIKLVPANYYRSLWTALGLSCFGVPFGIGFATAMDNMGLFGVGIPLGFGIGLAIGYLLDQKAMGEGRVLHIDA